MQKTYFGSFGRLAANISSLLYQYFKSCWETVFLYPESNSQRCTYQAGAVPLSSVPCPWEAH